MPRYWAARVGALDATVRLWDPAENLCLGELAIEDAVLSVCFGAAGKVLLVRTITQVHVVRVQQAATNALVPICRYDLTGAFEPVRTSMALHPTLGLLATIDEDDRRAIKIERLRLGDLIRYADLDHRSCRAATVCFLGGRGAGKTNLIRALRSEPFTTAQEDHAFRASLLPPPAPEQPDLVQETILWDPPSRGDHPLVQRIDGGIADVAVAVLSPVGKDPLGPDNIDRWRTALRSWVSMSRQQQTSLLVAINRSEALSPTGPGSAAEVARELGVDQVYLVSVKAGAGIDAIRTAISQSIDWPATTSFHSFGILEDVQAFIEGQRGRGRYLVSAADLRANFVETHPTTSQHVQSGDAFKRALQVLQARGQIHLFVRSDEETNFGVLLTRSYYHVYASAMIVGAEADEKQMGRLPLEEALSGDGRQMVLPECDRINDPIQERRVLADVVENLVHHRLAQKVSADGSAYLVFPRSVIRVLDASKYPPDRSWEVTGPIEEIFHSAVVRFSALAGHYPRVESWRNAAMFDLPSGGRCGLVIAPEENVMRVSVFFQGVTSAEQRDSFAGLVERMFRSRATSMLDLLPHRTEPAAAGEKAESVEVVLVGRTTGRNRRFVRKITRMLRQEKIRPWLAEQDLDPGDTEDRRIEKLRGATVAAIFLSTTGLSQRHREELALLSRPECRVIPIITPAAGPAFLLPKALRNHVNPLDFRAQEVDGPEFRRLVKSIRRKTRPARVPQSATAFLSYCREDAAEVDGLRAKLQAYGHHVWLDRASLVGGEDWTARVRQAIAESYAFVVCLSPNLAAKARSEVYAELSDAAREQRRLRPGEVFIVPIRIGPCKAADILSTGGPRIAKLNVVDCFGEDEAAGIVKLATSLDRARERTAPGATGGRPHTIRQETRHDG